MACGSMNRLIILSSKRWREKVMERGRVKWFNANKGFGFISQEGGEDVFVHFSVIDMDGYKTLVEGAEVQFEATKGDKGLQATRVISI
jgi:cold shock protein